MESKAVFFFFPDGSPTNPPKSGTHSPMLDLQPHDVFLRPREHDGETALVLVAASGEAEMIHLLVRWMAEVDLPNRGLVQRRRISGANLINSFCCSKLVEIYKEVYEWFLRLVGCKGKVLSFFWNRTRLSIEIQAFVLVVSWCSRC